MEESRRVEEGRRQKARKRGEGNRGAEKGEEGEGKKRGGRRLAKGEED